MEKAWNIQKQEDIATLESEIAVLTERIKYDKKSGYGMQIVWARCMIEKLKEMKEEGSDELQCKRQAPNDRNKGTFTTG